MTPHAAALEMIGSKWFSLVLAAALALGVGAKLKCLDNEGRGVDWWFSEL